MAPRRLGARTQLTIELVGRREGIVRVRQRCERRKTYAESQKPSDHSQGSLRLGAIRLPEPPKSYVFVSCYKDDTCTTARECATREDLTHVNALCCFATAIVEN